MVIEAAEQVVAVAGALTGAVLVGAMAVSGWCRERPVPVPVRR